MHLAIHVNCGKSDGDARRGKVMSRIVKSPECIDYRSFFFFMKGLPMSQVNCTPSHQSLDSRARRAAQRCELIARKSRKYDPLNNDGGFMLVDFNNCPQAGFRYDLTAEEVIEFCS